jgi:glycosyltransferase involved in cell wall biosynthesis
MNKFSVITINFNNREGLSKTIESLKNINSGCIEFIVVDGGSTDGSKILLNDSIINNFVSEKDEGIYDAMNKGIELASHQWVIFMNSGDVFCKNFDIKVLQKVKNIDKYNLIYGDQYNNGKHIGSLPLFFVELGIIPASHQSMFFKKPIKYDLNYKIYSDFDLFARIYKQGNLYHINYPICEREPGGISNVTSLRKRYEKFLITYKHFGIVSLIRALVFSIFFRGYL